MVKEPNQLQRMAISAAAMLVLMTVLPPANAGHEIRRLVLEAPFQAGSTNLIFCGPDEYPAIPGSRLMTCTVAGSGDAQTGRASVAGLLPSAPVAISEHRFCTAPGICANGGGLIQGYRLPESAAQVDHFFTFNWSAATATTQGGSVRALAWADATHHGCGTCRVEASQTVAEGQSPIMVPPGPRQSLLAIRMENPDGPVPPGNVTLRFFVTISFAGSPKETTASGTAVTQLSQITVDWVPAHGSGSDCPGKPTHPPGKAKGHAHSKDSQPCP